MILKSQKFLLFSLYFLSISPLFALTFYDLNGKKMDLTSFLSAGKWTIVEVWSSRCGICRQQMPEMVKLHQQLKNNTQILGISLDTLPKINKAQAFVKEYKIHFKNVITNSLAIDAWLREIAKVRLRGTPTFIIFDPKGQISALQSGFVEVEIITAYIKKKSEQL